jgi:hypothetical protein
MWGRLAFLHSLHQFPSQSDKERSSNQKIQSNWYSFVVVVVALSFSFFFFHFETGSASWPQTQDPLGSVS